MTCYSKGHEPSTSLATTVLKMKNKKTFSKPKQYSVGQEQQQNSTLPKGACVRCGKTNHASKDFRFISSTCNFCRKKGHLESVCLTKKRSQGSIKYIPEEGELPVEIVKSIQGQDPVMVQLQVNGKKCEFEVDSGVRDNFCSEKVWKKLGRPALQSPTLCYVSATGNPLPVMGTFQLRLPYTSPSQIFNVTFNVTTLNQLYN